MRCYVGISLMPSFLLDFALRLGRSRSLHWPADFSSRRMIFSDEWWAKDCSAGMLFLAILQVLLANPLLASEDCDGPGNAQSSEGLLWQRMKNVMGEHGGTKYQEFRNGLWFYVTLFVYSLFVHVSSIYLLLSICMDLCKKESLVRTKLQGAFRVEQTFGPAWHHLRGAQGNDVANTVSWQLCHVFILFF